MPFPSSREVPGVRISFKMSRVCLLNVMFSIVVFFPKKKHEVQVITHELIII